MKLLIDISEYNAEYIKNAYGIPQDINVVIAEAIINGKQIPTPHGRLIDADALINELASEHVGGLEAIKKYTNADTWTSGLHTAWRTIDDADTIIEAEE